MFEELEIIIFCAAYMFPTVGFLVQDDRFLSNAQAFGVRSGYKRRKPDAFIVGDIEKFLIFLGTKTYIKIRKQTVERSETD